MASAEQAPARRYAFVVMRFDDRNRYGQNGIPASILFSGGARCVVRMKEDTIAKAGKRNRFGKVELLGEQTDGFGEARLEELLGHVGEYADELRAYQRHFCLLYTSPSPRD